MTSHRARMNTGGSKSLGWRELTQPEDAWVSLPAVAGRRREWHWLRNSAPVATGRQACADPKTARRFTRIIWR